MERKKWIGLVIIASIIGIYSMPSVLGLTIGTDPSNDLRKFTPTWLEANTEAVGDWGNASTSLNSIYITLRDHWDNPGIVLTGAEYTIYNYIDILNIAVTGLDETNATFTVTVAGDAENAALPWMIFIWSNCSPDGNNFWFMAFGGTGGIGDYDWSIFMGLYGSENVTGTPEYGPGGTSISMDFPSDWWDQNANCGLYVMMLTVDSIDSPGYYILDIYPNGAVPFWLNIWFWIILLAALIGIIAGYMIYKNSKDSKSKNRKRRRVK